ncbi:HERV-H LTR-associating 2 isoform X1 [Pelobates cultripes]|uniref:HERV-H LTR-associating 2 isoform X1 n=1 Tax=Pelobates cultripes TaxID=61616 RepID=A0AAD1R356_PELCU|nr:HERV-H LTR-associating 2 isoform X1 [Pelobates cultripes]
MKKRKMKDTYICFICVNILFFPLVYSDTEVWGELTKEVILPCSFKPSEQEVIHWNVDENSRNVHSYYHGQEHLEDQDTNYRGRTSLFLSELSSGNASLKITHVKKSDENTYSCYVGTQTGNRKYVKLHIAAFEQQSIEYISDNSGKMYLNCTAKNIIPDKALDIVWYKNNIRLASGSSFEIENITDTLECLMYHANLNRSWTGSWEMAKLNVTEGASVILGCEMCQAIQKQNFTVKWSWRKRSTETEIASMDLSKTLKIADTYTHRLEQNSGKYSFNIMHLTEEDSGEYLCTIIQTNGVHINMTSLTVSHITSPGHKALIIPLAFIVVCAVAGLTYYKCKT